MYGLWAVLILTIGTGVWSFYVSLNLYTDAWSPHCAKPGVALEYVSTRIAQCLDTRPAYMWSLVYCVEVQIMVLLSLWRRLFASHHFVTNLREGAISCGVWFVISFAMVVEFRNDSNALTKDFLIFPPIQESSLHSYAAVNAMLSLTVLHVILCSSLLSLSNYERKVAREKTLSNITSLKTMPAIDFDFRRNQIEHETEKNANALLHWRAFKLWLYQYAALDWLYLVCVIVFFFTWASASYDVDSNMYETSVHTEWVVLALGAMMQGYALWQSERPLSWTTEPAVNLFVSMFTNVRNCKTSWRVLLSSCSFIAAVLYTLIIFGMAPLQDNNEDSKTGARSSTMLLWTVITTYIYAALLLLS